MQWEAMITNHAVRCPAVLLQSSILAPFKKHLKTRIRPAKPRQTGREPCEVPELALDGALFVETFKRAW
jgi:hypothetical protein